MTRSTHYELLGLEPFASPEEIREARRRRLIIVHPDNGRTLEDRTRREQLSAAVNLAADTLLNPRTRRSYDQRLGIRQPLLPVAATRAVRRGSAPLIHTRIGQWLILMTLLLFGALFGGNPWFVGTLTAAVALLLARAGEPTPLVDLERILGTLLRFMRGPGARVGRAAAVAAGSSFRERLDEARREVDGGVPTTGSLPRRSATTQPDAEGERPPSARGDGRDSRR